MKDLPICCGSEMKTSLELGRFIEVQCNKCNDVIYIKRQTVQTPVLIDD